MSLINKDFNHVAGDHRQPVLRWLLAGLGTAVVLVTAVIIATSNAAPDKNTVAVSQMQSSQTSVATKADKPSQDKTAIPAHAELASYKLPLPAIQKQPQPQTTVTTNNTDTASADKTASQQWQKYRVKRGDSLAKIFQRAKIQPAQLLAMMDSGKATKTLLNIHPKDTLKIRTDNAGDLEALRYEIDPRSYLLVERNNQNQLTAAIHKYDIEVRHRYAQGVINSSLYDAASAAGMSDNVTAELTDIFAWDIDFAHDLRKGDSFSVLYNEIYRNGEKIADGGIIAAEFTSNGRTYRAVRYEKPGSTDAQYYTPSGKSMRKAFLRAPLKYKYISSPFSLMRYHPILHIWRRHDGVDFAAPRGTPIHAAGDGKIIFKGIKGGYGRVIIIQHNAKYSTLYAHMNSYNKHVWAGKRVKQGQVIGYVGSSGLATGPHLHYEFRVYGVHKNPMTVKLPDAKPIMAKYRNDFMQKTQPVLAQLDLLTRTQLAFNP